MEPNKQTPFLRFLERSKEKGIASAFLRLLPGARTGIQHFIGKAALIGTAVSLAFTTPFSVSAFNFWNLLGEGYLIEIAKNADADELNADTDPVHSLYILESSAFRAHSAPPKPEAPEAPKPTVQAPRAAKASQPSPAPSRVVTDRVTVPMSAYSSTPDQTDGNPFITASGTRVRDGVIAANFLPIGTRVRIPEYYGDKVFVVEDRMNARYWKKIDIWMPTRSAALQFGVRYATIEVIN